MTQVPDPASELAYDAAADARRLILNHLDASDVGVNALFMTGLDSVVQRSFSDIPLENRPDGYGDYLACLLSALSYVVRSLALQAAPLDPDANLRRLITEFDERHTTF